MKENRIKLTESDLHYVVNEAVKDILVKEGLWDGLKGLGRFGANKAKQGMNNAYQSATNKARQFGNNVAQGVNNAYNNVANKARQFGNNVAKGVNNAKQAYQAASANGNIQNDCQKGIEAINNLRSMFQKYQGNPNFANITRQVNSQLSALTNTLNKAMQNSSNSYQDTMNGMGA